MDFGAIASPLRCHANFKYLSIFVYVFLCRQTQGKCVNEHISVSKIYFKELAYTFTDSVKSRVCTVGQLTEASEKR